MFSLPHIGATRRLPFHGPDAAGIDIPGQVLSVMISERESCFPVFVFTRIIPVPVGTAMAAHRHEPAVEHNFRIHPTLRWGVEGFVGINANGATFRADMSTQ